MLVDWIALALAGLGHACLLVLLVNVVHSLGNSRRTTDWLSVAILAAWLAIPAGLIGSGAGPSWTTWPLPIRAYAAACLGVALIGLPATTIARWLRRRPRGIAERSGVIDLVPAEAEADFVGDGRHAWLLRLPGNGWRQLQRSAFRVEVADLPRACDGLTIVQVSDLHFAPCFRRAYFEAVAAAAADWEADLVLFTGDLIDDDDCIDWIVPVLSRLRGRLGTYSILGNHDHWQDVPRLLGELQRAGFEDLEGRWATVDVGGSTLAIGGTSAPWGPRLDLAGPVEADLRILLSHSPDLFYKAAAGGVDLMLSGHNHGGQIRLPIVGPALMPSRYSRRFDRGFFRSGRTLMYVSQGIAGKHPVRYGCTPEISRFQLRAAPRRQAPHAGLLSQDHAARSPSAPTA